MIGSSQMYASERTMKQGIASVMRNAVDSPVVEELGE
ncbi:MAG: YegP family protein [Bacteroidales bacterium]|nr:YegP family protein [Bacteroidales bacterium]